MPRHIAFCMDRIGTMLPCTLQDELAPHSAAFLWSLAGKAAECTVNHAIWTGPELSVPLPASTLPKGVDMTPVPAENATSYPRAGDVVVAWLAAGSVSGLPPGDFFDIGVFYDDGGRLLMPFGWIQANVAARIASADLDIAKEMARNVRQQGSTNFRIVQL